MREARLNIAVTGEIDREGLLKSINERYDDSEAAVVVTWKRHNEHVVMQRGIIIGEFSECYRRELMQALMGSWGRRKVIWALLRALLRPEAGTGGTRQAD